jgi:hypothetical protein
MIWRVLNQINKYNGHHRFAFCTIQFYIITQPHTLNSDCRVNYLAQIIFKFDHKEI